jgi:predicted O-methyltransferase YrrM
MTQPDVNEAEYFRQFTPHEKGILEDLEREAREKDIPIVGPLVGKILWTMVNIKNAKRILELGTATGYSAIWIAKALSETKGELTSVEWDAELAQRARENIQKANVGCDVKVISRDAKSLLLEFEENHFDMIFQDIEKEMYLELLGECARVLKPGGLIVFDNTAFISAGNFLKEALLHPDLDGFHLYAFLPEHQPEYDGLTFLIKKGAVNK